MTIDGIGDHVKPDSERQVSHFLSYVECRFKMHTYLYVYICHKSKMIKDLVRNGE